MGRPPIIRRERLLEVARRLFARKGFEATTLADIATRLRVSPAAILGNTGSKEALFLEAMSASRIELPPRLRSLETDQGVEDPRRRLREVAEELVPFLRKRIKQMLAIQMHLRRSPGALAVPSAVRSRTGAPARALAILEDYFRRASRARTVRVRDPRAAAILFLGALQSYVILHYVLDVAPKPFPLKSYLDTLFDVLSKGALHARS